MSGEWPEITDGQLRALRELRFVTVNKERNRMWGMDDDPLRVEAVGQGCVRFERAEGKYDCEMTSQHPRLIAEVERILGLSRA